MIPTLIAFAVVAVIGVGAFVRWYVREHKAEERQDPYGQGDAP